MTVYRLSTPNTRLQGSIDDVLEALSHEIEPGNYYWVDESHDLTGTELVKRLISLRAEAEPDHTYVERVTFRRSVNGPPGEYEIERVTPEGSLTPGS